MSLGHTASVYPDGPLFSILLQEDLLYIFIIILVFCNPKYSFLVVNDLLPPWSGI